jgi:hypothetical protein
MTHQKFIPELNSSWKLQILQVSILRYMTVKYLWSSEISFISIFVLFLIYCFPNYLNMQEFLT